MRDKEEEKNQFMGEHTYLLFMAVKYFNLYSQSIIQEISCVVVTAEQNQSE